MRYEPPFDLDAIRDLLRREYALEADELAFVPVGFATACYVVDSHFLKIWPHSANGGQSASLLEVTLPLLVRLDAIGLRARVPAPIRTTSGELRTSYHGMPVALFPLLPGDHVPDDAYRDPVLWAEMARVMAEIHAATPSLASVPLATESFEAPVLPTLARGLLVAERGGAEARGLDRVVRPRRDELVQHIARFERVRAAAAGLTARRVLCHRDFGGYNLLVGPDGRLSVLDWDWPALAPPEHDLWFAAGEGLASFLAAYRESGGAGGLHREQFEFAILRRGLDDLGARVVRLLDHEVSDAEADELLDGIVRWGFERCASVDSVLSSLD
jgi:aminoglycoside phosphotransferase (APT) family kinase protein